MVLGKSAPFVRAFVDAVDAAIRRHQPHHAMSVTQRTLARVLYHCRAGDQLHLLGALCAR